MTILPPYHDQVQTAVETNTNVLLVGPAGTGKSTSARVEASRRGKIFLSSKVTATLVLKICAANSASARANLTTRMARRAGRSSMVAIPFTDGEANDQQEAVRQSVLLRRMGARLLIGAMDIDQCKVAFPGSAVFSVDPSSAARSLKAMVRRMNVEI